MQLPKKQSSDNEIIIDLLQKLTIIELAKAGATRNEIKNILKLGSNKVTEVFKFFSRKRGQKNER
jgi:hypothetical protein